MFYKYILKNLKKQNLTKFINIKKEKLIKYFV